MCTHSIYALDPNVLCVLTEQGECWFQLRHSVNQAAGTPISNPSVILKERLRTLGETASLIARAVVNKGNQTSIHRHPDYLDFEVAILRSSTLLWLPI
jgi:hypothetical protein